MIKSLRHILLYGFLFLWLILLSLPAIAQGSWGKIESPTHRILHSVYFTDSLYGWAVGDTGTIIHTMDGGQSWLIQDSETENSIRDVFFLNRDTGFAISWNYDGIYFGTLIHKTINGGEEWTSYEYQEQNLFMNCILFLDRHTAWMGGSPHALVKSVDGGVSWNQVTIEPNPLAFFPVLNIEFYNEKYGYACGGMFDIAGVTWSTTDGGDHWYPIKPDDAPADEVYGLHPFDSITVMGSGGDPDQGYGVAMIFSNDAGQNWSYEELGIQGNAFDLDFRTNNDAWAPLGPQQKLIYSQDAGISWSEYPSPENTEIYDIIFIDSLHGFGVGKNGAIIKYKPVIIGIHESGEKDPCPMKIYPNPVSSYSNIYFSLPGDPGNDPYEVKLLAYNNAGRSVKILTNKKMQSGDHVIRFLKEGMLQGIYYIQLQAVGNTGTIYAAIKVIVLQE